jgi:hypothetical protein
VAAVLPQKPLTPQEALERVRYIQQHNHAAYLSQRRRILKRLVHLGLNKHMVYWNRISEVWCSMS